MAANTTGRSTLAPNPGEPIEVSALSGVLFEDLKCMASINSHSRRRAIVAEAFRTPLPSIIAPIASTPPLLVEFAAAGEGRLAAIFLLPVVEHARRRIAAQP